MELKLVKAIIADVDRVRDIWERKATDEIREIFKRQHDAFLSGDSSVPMMEGAPHFYAAMEHGELGLLKLIGEDFLSRKTKSVTHDGVIEGDGKYETHDIGWVRALIVFLEHLLDGDYENLELPPFHQDYQPMVIGNDATIAIIGDWGTGYWQHDKTPAAKVARHVNHLNPDVVIHLGDVYYDGSRSEVKSNLIDVVPTGSSGTFNLNSNHDMYSAARPYFKAITSEPFGYQGNTSYFAITNDHWIIVGLDTAYLSSPLDGFMYGTLGKLHPLTDELIANPQTEFLKKMVLLASSKNKNLMIACHHNAFDGAGMTHEAPLHRLTKKTLWAQISTLIEPCLQGNKVYWYWGHAHCGYTLKEMGNIFSRCVGHSAVPWGKGSDYYTGSNSNVEWFEDTKIPDASPCLANGFMSLSLQGSDLTEKFYTQENLCTYTAINGRMQPPD